MADLFVIFVIFLLVLYSNRTVASAYAAVDRPMLIKSWDALFLYHCVFSFLFPLLPGDAIGYWDFGLQQILVHSENMRDYLGVGTIFLLFLDFIPVKILGLSFATGNFLYGVMGFLGMRYLFRLFIESLKVNVRIFKLPVIPYLFYLPNLNFWTSGVGKDTLCFFGIACFLHALRSYEKRVIPLVLSFVLVYYIRPHVAMMVIGGVAIGIIFSGNVKTVYRILIPIAAIGVFFLVHNQVAAFLRVDDLSVKTLEFVAADKAAVLSGIGSGSSVNVSGSSLPIRLLTYLYRPLFFDSHNFITLFSSVENLVYLVISVMGIRAIRRRDFRRMPFWMVSGGFIFLASTIVFANSLGNLGIIMRMKNMTMIYFLMILIWTMSERKAEQKALTSI